MDSIDWTGLSVLFYLLVAACVAMHAFVEQRASIFEPIGQYLLFVSLFTLPLPIRACMTLEIEGDVTPYLPALLPYMAISVVFSALSLVLFSMTYFSAWPQRVAAALPQPTGNLRERSLIAFMALALASATLIYLLTQEAGGLLPFLLLGYGSTEETFGRGYLAMGFPWAFVATLFLLMRYARRRVWLDAIMFFVALAGVVAMNIITGSRSMLVYVAIVTLLFTHYAVRPLKLKVVMPLGIAAFVALNLLGALRASNYENIEDFAEKSSSTAERVVTENSEGLFYTLTIGEFVVPFETLPQMVRTVGTSDNPWFGLSYLRTPVFAIPSAVFPERPPSLAYWYMQRFYGEGFGLNEGRQFFFLAEGYLNFGPAGILIVALAWGWFWAVLHHWMLRSRGEPVAVLIYALTAGFMFRGISGDFATLVAGLAQQSLLAAIIGLMISGVTFYMHAPENGRAVH